MTTPTSPTPTTSSYPDFSRFVSTLLTALGNFQRGGKDYLTYLASTHADDEMDMRTSVGFAIFEALGWKFGSTGNDILHDTTAATGSRPDILVKLPADERIVFVVETKSTNEKKIDEGDPHYVQLEGYIKANGITLGILTNHVRVNCWLFRDTPQLLCSFDLREIYEQHQTSGGLTSEQTQQLRVFWQNFRKEVFVGLDALRAGIYANPYRPVNEAAHEEALTRSLSYLTEQLRSNALVRFTVLTNEYDEYEQARGYLDDAKTQPAQATLDQQRTAAINQIRNSFRTANVADAMVGVLTSFEQNYQQQSDLAALRVALWRAAHPTAAKSANPDDTGLDNAIKYARTYLDYQRRARRLDNTYRHARDFRANFDYWRDVNEQPTASPRDFCLQTVYVQLVRLLLVRICEDKGLLKRMISDGGFEKFDSDFKVSFFEYIKDAYNQLLNLVYLNTRSVYAHFFDRSDLFDWYQADENILLAAFATLNQYNFAEVNSDIIGMVYERYLEGERKLTGQYYTPTVVVEYIMDTLGYEGAAIVGSNVLDLSCGSGKFLVTAANRMVKAYRASGQYQPHEIINEVAAHVFGFDLNPFACYLAEINLLVQLIDLLKEVRGYQRDFTLPRFRVYRTNSLRLPRNGNGNGNGQIKFLDDLELEASIAEERTAINQIMTLSSAVIPGGGFDFVVGNPPYGAELDEDTAKYLTANYITAEGEYDTYAAFIERGLDMLKVGGKLGYITPNTWTTNKFYRRLRLLTLTTTRIADLVQTWEMFDQATVNSLIFVLNKQADKADLFPNGISRQLLDEPDTAPAAQMGTATIHDLPAKFDRVLGTRQPSATVRRRALLADRSFAAERTIEQADWWSNDGFLFNLTLDPADAAIIQQVKQRSVQLGSIVDITLGVKSYEVGTGSPPQTTADLTNKVFHSQTQKPGYRAELLTDDVDRYYVHFGGRNWVKFGPNLAAPRAARFWSQPKLIVPKISGGMRERIRAAYDDQNYICPTNFSVMMLTNSGFSLKYLLVLLNSRLFNWYFEHAYLDKNVKVYHLNALPVKPLAADGQQPLINLADQLIALNDQIGSYRDAGYRVNVERGRIIPPISQLLKPLGANVADLRHAAATGVITVQAASKGVSYPITRSDDPATGQSVLHLRRERGNEISVTAATPVIDYIQIALNEQEEQLKGKTWAQLAPLVPFPRDEATAHTGLKLAQAKIAEVQAVLADIRTLDRQANDMVYQLYGLDAAEIAIVGA